MIETQGVRPKGSSGSFFFRIFADFQYVRACASACVRTYAYIRLHELLNYLYI